MRKQNGFTLIEIAIVLVIIGLLLGGVLKGQELITAARVRNLAAQLDGVKIAYLGFQDRYRALPGDYPLGAANANIPGPAGNATLGCAGANCSNGKIDDTGGVGGNESILVWHQLARAGFIIGSYDGVAAAPTATNTPTNPFSGYLQIIFDNDYSDVAAPVANAMNIKTGSNVPSPILAELDRKIDDGLPQTGALRFSPVWGGSTATCLSGAAYNAAVDIKTCGGAQLQ
jgi:prepilin-type N-terminal cleavage/methylation domain-containing protein